MLATKVPTLRCSSIAAAAIPGNYLVGSTNRSTHQRRRSSSKASCPPDSSNKATPAAKDVTASTTSLDESTSAQSTIRTKRTSKYRRPTQLKAAKEDATTSAYASLPSVPNVDHLDPKDLCFSSFFSLHRPLSLTHPFPPSVTEEAFSAIFESKEKEDPWTNGNSAERRPEDVIYALSQTIESIENASAASQNEVVHIDVLSESASHDEETARHLGRLQRARIPRLEEIVAQAKPFQAPPPPQAFVNSSESERKRSARGSKQAAPRTKSYSTTIVVTESRLPNGETTYEASTGPFTRIPDMEDDAQSGTASWTPYRRRRVDNLAPSFLARRFGRLSIRNPRTQARIRPEPSMRKPTMLLISVRRQRKMKMKKHKYKKLMKRTRNLRRKLENK